MFIGQSQLLNPIFWAGTTPFFALMLLVRSFRWVRYALLAVPILMIVLLAALGEFEGIRGFVNWLCGPQRILFLSV